MGNIVASEFIILDGVIEAPGGEGSLGAIKSICSCSMSLSMSIVRWFIR